MKVILFSTCSECGYTNEIVRKNGPYVLHCMNHNCSEFGKAYLPAQMELTRHPTEKDLNDKSDKTT